MMRYTLTALTALFLAVCVETYMWHQDCNRLENSLLLSNSTFANEKERLDACSAQLDTFRQTNHDQLEELMSQRHSTERALAHSSLLTSEYQDLLTNFKLAQKDLSNRQQINREMSQSIEQWQNLCNSLERTVRANQLTSDQNAQELVMATDRLVAQDNLYISEIRAQQIEDQSKPDPAPVIIQSNPGSSGSAMILDHGDGVYSVIGQ